MMGFKEESDEDRDGNGHGEKDQPNEIVEEGLGSRKSELSNRMERGSELNARWYSTIFPRWKTYLQARRT